MSNSAYADQRVYGGDIVDISNSPFTDERRQGGGGGTPGGDGQGNVQYETSDETLNIRVAEVNTLITAIDQGANEFVIGNDRGTLDFTQSGDVVLSHGFQDSGNLVIKAEATSTGNGNILIETETSNILGAGDINLTSKNSVRLTSDESTVINAKALSSSSEQGTFISSLNQDVEILAKEFSFVRGEKGVMIESGLLNGVYENSIDLEIDQQNSKIVIKSEGDSFENRILLQTVSNGVNAGGCNLVLVSDDIPANSDKILLNVQSILQNQEWLNIKGTDTNNDEHSLVITRDEVKFSAFEFFNFAGQDQLGVTPKNPVFQFSNIQTNKEEYYQFSSFPTSPGQILEISAGLGGQSTPWELNWITPANPPVPSIGNVQYDPSSLDYSLKYGATSTVIDQIALGDNDVNGLDFEAFVGLDLTTGSGELLFMRKSSGTNGSSAEGIEIKCTRSFGPLNASSLRLITPQTSGTHASFNLISPRTNPSVETDVPSGYFNIFENANEAETLGERMSLIKYADGTRAIYYEGFTYHLYQNINASNPMIQTTTPMFNYRNDKLFPGPDPSTYKRTFFRWNNKPTAVGQVLTNAGGAGTSTSPFNMEWIAPGAGSLNNLEINYDTTTSTLVLSDPVDGLPVISTTTIVPGRTVLIEDVVVNGTTELSALGLSNSIFPPPLEGQTGYFAGLIGNSPPRVSLNPITGLTNWFPGASFKITLAGKITKIGGYDDIRLKVYSNRGQPSENILNSFSMITRSVQPPPQVGWNWVIDFTCRKVNDGGVLGVISTSSAFNYTDDTYILENLGAIVSNVNSSFDTSVEQFLDCTIEFDYYNDSNSISTTLCTIERIF